MRAVKWWFKKEQGRCLATTCSGVYPSPLRPPGSHNDAHVQLPPLPERQVLWSTMSKENRNSEHSEAPNPGGGSFLIAWQLKDKHVLIVGGGEVASQRVDSILTADAFITILSPSKGLNPRTKHLIDLHPSRITYYDRRFTGPAELHKMDMVLTALDDVHRSREIVEMCRKAKVPVNAADIPESCDFYFGSQIRDGPLQIMISTNGNGPRMASLIKSKLQAGLSGHEGEAIDKVGYLREQLKVRAPGVGGALGRKRMKWMTQLCNEWDMDAFCMLDEEKVAKLLDEGWEKGRVPTVEEVVGAPPIQPGVVVASQSTKAIPEAPTPVPIPAQGDVLRPALGFIAGALCMAAVTWSRRR